MRIRPVRALHLTTTVIEHIIQFIIVVGTHTCDAEYLWYVDDFLPQTAAAINYVYNLLMQPASTLYSRPWARIHLSTITFRAMEPSAQWWYWATMMGETLHAIRRGVLTQMIMPPCTWCGHMTGNWCDQCEQRQDRQLRPLCTTCEAYEYHGVCRLCRLENTTANN